MIEGDCVGCCVLILDCLFLFLFLFLVPMGPLCLLDCLLAEHPGQEMWSSRSSSVEFVTQACIKSTMTGDNQSTPWFLGKFHFSQFMRSRSMEKRWWVQSGTSSSSIEAHELWSIDGSSLYWSSCTPINILIFSLVKLRSSDHQMGGESTG